MEGSKRGVTVPSMGTVLIARSLRIGARSPAVSYPMIGNRRSAASRSSAACIVPVSSS